MTEPALPAPLDASPAGGASRTAVPEPSATPACPRGCPPAGATGREARLRVLVTRPQAQAAETCDLLRRAGLEPVCFPTVVTQPVEDTAALDAAVAALPAYRWAVFASANAARVFWQHARRLGRAAVSPAAGGASPKIVAGPATAKVLAELGVAADLVLAPFSAAAAAQALVPLTAPGDHVLLPRAEDGLDVLAPVLRARGVLVDEVTLYRTVPVTEGAGPIAAQLAAGAFGALLFFSPSAVRGFAAAMAGAGLAGARLTSAIGVSVVACIGSTTATTAQSMGWHVDVVPPDTSARSLVATLAAHLAALTTSRRSPVPAERVQRV